jgi:hypothetical protein
MNERGRCGRAAEAVFINADQPPPSGGGAASYRYRLLASVRLLTFAVDGTPAPYATIAFGPFGGSCRLGSMGYNWKPSTQTAADLPIVFGVERSVRMRAKDSPMSAEEFEDNVRAARDGLIRTDNGASQAVDAALKQIAATPPGPEQNAAEAVARRLFRDGV